MPISSGSTSTTCAIDGARPRVTHLRPLVVGVVVAAAMWVSLGAQASWPEVRWETLAGFAYQPPDLVLAAPMSRTPATGLPASVKALDGKAVRIRGFILPLDITPDGVSEFILNGTIDMCYFGAPVALNEWILVSMKGGLRTPMTHLPVMVAGDLEVGERIEHGQVTSLYRMRADGVMPTK